MDPNARIALWHAVNEYAQACGGDTTARRMTLVREQAVSAVSTALDAAIEQAVERKVHQAKCALADEFVEERDRDAVKRMPLLDVVEAAVAHHAWHHEAKNARDADAVRALMEEAAAHERERVAGFLRGRGLDKLALQVLEGT